MIVNELELAERVAAGAEFMDAIDAYVTDDAERWFWVVEPSRLNMRLGVAVGGCGCVMTQHAGTYLPAKYGLDDNGNGGAIALGFDIEWHAYPEVREYRYAALAALWVEEINERRAAWFDKHPEAVIREDA